MTFGRRVPGDSEGKGFVWATPRALNLARLRLTAELGAFWQQLERASFRIVGEEFPNFTGVRLAPPARRPTGSARSPRAARCGAGWPAATSPA